MNVSFYQPRSAFFIATHPSARLLSVIALFVPAFFTDDPVFQSVYFGLTLLLALGTRATVNLWRLKGLALSIFLVSLVLWTLSLPGRTPLFSCGPLTIYDEAMMHGLGRALRLLSFLVLGVAFLTVTSIEEFTYGLRSLGVPYRVGFAISLAFRLAPLFLETAGHVANAHRARGVELDKGPFWRRWPRYAPLMVPVLVSGFRRADQMSLALEAKGFGFPGPRTHLISRSPTWRDGLLLCVVISLNIGGHFLTKF
ncbi:MAG: energy-coupling factor transporter transmembrane component T [Candidatus Lernaella stagnicola]|nr:energy-coupling factor transporter transmembrane component T [Candidatus Lernaella stagnicola]